MTVKFNTQLHKTKFIVKLMITNETLPYKRTLQNLYRLLLQYCVSFYIYYNKYNIALNGDNDVGRISK